jgi:hypothetical protein
MNFASPASESVGALLQPRKFSRGKGQSTATISRPALHCRLLSNSKSTSWAMRSLAGDFSFLLCATGGAMSNGHSIVLPAMPCGLIGCHQRK